MKASVLSKFGPSLGRRLGCPSLLFALGLPASAQPPCRWISPVRIEKIVSARLGEMWEMWCRMAVIGGGGHVPGDSLVEGLRQAFEGWKIAGAAR